MIESLSRQTKVTAPLKLSRTVTPERPDLEEAAQNGRRTRRSHCIGGCDGTRQPFAGIGTRAKTGVDRGYMAENMRQNGSGPSPGVCGGLTGPGTVTPPRSGGRRLFRKGVEEVLRHFLTNR